MQGGPPHWLAGVLWCGMAALLLYPLQVAYQVPDQDLPVRGALLEHVRGGWSPISLHFPSGFTNLLRIIDDAASRLGGPFGVPRDPLDLLAWWNDHLALMRIPPRLLGMLAGIASLVAVRGLVATVADRTSALLAAVLLGSSLMFVREHHNGMYDALPSAAIAGLLWACAVHARAGSRRSIAAAGALLGAAIACKQNSAIAGCALVVALALSPAAWRERVRGALLAALCGVAAILVLSPAILLEPTRFAEALRMHLTLLYVVGPGLLGAGTSYGLADALGNGLGWALVGVAAVGALRALVRRERGLVPAIAFALVYGAVVARSQLVFNRYALPLATPVAALAAYAIAGVRAPRARLALALGLVALALPATLAYLRLLGREDTRVAAAAWLRAHRRPDQTVFLPGPVWFPYVGPDLPRRFALPNTIEPALRDEIARRLPPPLPGPFRFASWLPPARGGDPLGAFAGAIVVTVEHPSPLFARVMSTPELVRGLEGGAQLLADFPIEPPPGERRAGVRVYEPGDLNFAPIAGASTLDHPGPRVRIWSVPARPASAVR